MAAKPPRIFVSIASYRDPECQWTIKDLFEKARLPDRVSVGLCWQFLPGEDDDCFLFQDRPAQCRSVTVNAHESRGACWARSQVQTLYDGEDYYLQTDSHMRFVPDWDEKLVAMLDTCPSPRPILSTYPPAYTPPDQLQDGFFTVLKARDFNEQGVLGLHSHLIAVKDVPPVPILNPFCAGGLLFAPGAAILDVPYDPHLYFTGEEITLAVRFWTHGWDMFAPNGIIAFHDYGHARRRHWQDNKNWGGYSLKAARRLRHLLGMEPANDRETLEEINKYGLGTVRDLAGYQAFSGVTFKTKTVEPRPIGPPWNAQTAAYTVGQLRLTEADIPKLNDRARALGKAGKFEAALLLYDYILAIQPERVDAAYSRANALLVLKRYEETLDGYRQAARNPAYAPEALYGIGIACDHLRRWPEAAAALSEAVALRPELHYLRLLALVYFRLGDLEAAEMAGRHLIRLAPEDVDGNITLAQTLINAGKAEGWSLYEWRWKRHNVAATARHTRLPRWRGEPLAGRRLILWSEPGTFDDLMFARYLPPLLAEAGEVVLECEAPRVALLARAFPSCRVLARDSRELGDTAATLECPVGSLPHLTGRAIESLAFPALHPDPEFRQRFRERLAPEGDLLVTLSWRGGVAVPSVDPAPALVNWQPLLSIAGVRFIAIGEGQGAPVAAEIAAAQAGGFRLEALPSLDAACDPERDLDRLAALLAAADLHIGLDSLTTQLAGALGLESWMLLGHRADWHWPVQGERSPIYPGLRLFRAPRANDWAGVLAEAGRSLAGRLAKPKV